MVGLPAAETRVGYRAGLWEIGLKNRQQAGPIILIGEKSAEDYQAG